MFFRLQIPNLDFQFLQVFNGVSVACLFRAKQCDVGVSLLDFANSQGWETRHTDKYLNEHIQLLACKIFLFYMRLDCDIKIVGNIFLKKKKNLRYL